MPSDKQTGEGPPRKAYRRVSRGEWWHRPTCWVFGHRWAHPEGAKICTRCDRGELDGEYLVEADLDIGATRYDESE